MAVANASLAPSNPFSASASSRAAAPMSPQPHPLTQLPNVDFNFEDLRQRMSAFTVKFDAFIERGRKRVLEERNEFRERLGELAGTLTSSPVHIPIPQGSQCWGTDSLPVYRGPASQITIYRHPFLRNNHPPFPPCARTIRERRDGYRHSLAGKHSCRALQGS